MSTEHRNNSYPAEDTRGAANLNQVLVEVSDSAIDPRIIPLLPDHLLSDYIRNWRIWTVTGMSLAQKQWLAYNARDVLLTVKPIFTNYYLHPEVRRRSQNYLKDNEGYLYLTEILRDEGKYFRLAFDISGRVEFLREEVRTLTLAQNRATRDSAKGVVMVELGQTLRIQFGLYHQRSNLFYETLVHPGYRRAKQEEKRQDRLAWLLNTVQDEATEYPSLSIAQHDLQETNQDFLLFFGRDEGRQKRLEHKAKMRTLACHRLVWRLTRFGVDFSNLTL